MSNADPVLQIMVQSFLGKQYLNYTPIANQRERGGKLVLHFNGSYHSENYESIYWYLKQENPDLNIVTIHTVSQDDVTKLEEDNTGLADFTICVDEDMTKTR